MINFLILIPLFIFTTISPMERECMYNAPQILKFLKGEMTINEAIQQAAPGKPACLFFKNVLTGQINIAHFITHFKSIPFNELRKFVITLLEYGNRFEPLHYENIVDDYKHSKDVLISPLIRKAIYHINWQADPQAHDSLIARLELAAVVGDIQAVKEIICPANDWVSWASSFFVRPDQTFIEDRIRLINNSHVLAIASAYGHVQIVGILLSASNGSSHLINPTVALQRVNDLLEAGSKFSTFHTRKNALLTIQSLLSQANKQWKAHLNISTLTVERTSTPVNLCLSE